MVSKPSLTGQVPGGAVQDAATPARLSPPPRPRAAAAAAGARMRRRETGPGERRGWIQHGGAEPEPREETWEIKFLAEYSGDCGC